MDLLLTVIPDAEREHLIDFISQAFYDELDAAYNDGSPTTAQTNAIKKLQAAIAPLSAVYYANVGNVDISNSGIRVTHDEHSKSAFEWQVHRLQKTWYRIGMSRIDEALRWLEANKGDYTTWTASDAYTESKECFINNAREFTGIFSKLKNSRTVFLQMKPIMKRMEEQKIKPLLGDTLYDALKAEILAGNVSANNKKLLPYIKYSVAFFTIEKALTELSLEIDGNGIYLEYLNDSTDNYKTQQPATPDKTSTLATAANQNANHYLGQLTGYLDTHHDTYPDYPYSDEEVELNDNVKNKSYRV